MREFEDGQFDGAPRQAAAAPAVELFAQMARDAEGPVSWPASATRWATAASRRCSFFFAALNMIPLPPATSAILGLPLLIVSAQMVFGSKRAWLPRFVMEQPISAEHVPHGDGPPHPAADPARAHDPAALLAVLAQAGRPGHRHHRASCWPSSSPCRSRSATGCRPSRPRCSAWRCRNATASCSPSAALSASCRWRSSPPSFGAAAGDGSAFWLDCSSSVHFWQAVRSAGGRGRRI